MFLSNINKYGFTMFTYGGDSTGYFLYDWGAGGLLCGSGRGVFVSLWRCLISMSISMSMSRLQLFILFNIVLDRNCWFKLWVLQIRYWFVFCQRLYSVCVIMLLLLWFFGREIEKVNMINAIM